MEIVSREANEYAAAFSDPEDALLKRVADYTLQQHPKAHMLSGAVQGALLTSLARLLSPSLILDIGTFTGYSALCLAKGLKPGGRLYTLENRPEDAHIASTFIAESAFASQIEPVLTDAKTWIEQHPFPWDLVFLDADKTGYIEYYELLIPLMRKGGLMIADNVLFHGEVLQDSVRGKNPQAVQAFNEHVRADVRTTQVLLTVRDGLMLITKK
jgi:predicted O-methyltransferase YrrM